ncbi:hypothetical protein ACFVYS_42965, partial [Streptomyces sp. NPDC058295]
MTVNVLIRPPVYLRDARSALEDAAHEAQEILNAEADGLAVGDWYEPTPTRTSCATRRAVQLYCRTRVTPGATDGRAAEQLRDAVEDLHRTLDEFRRQLPGTVPDRGARLAASGGSGVPVRSAAQCRQDLRTVEVEEALLVLADL